MLYNKEFIFKLKDYINKMSKYYVDVEDTDAMSAVEYAYYNISV